MKCPKCKSEDVTIEMVSTAEMTKKRGNGLAGHAKNAARGVVAMGTFGMSNLFIKKSKGTNKTKIKNKKVCLCQNCGYDWVIK